MRLPTRQDGVENRDKVYCIRIKKRAGYSRRCKRKERGLKKRYF